MVRARAAILAALLGLGACTPSWFTHFPVEHAKEVARGQTPEQVKALVGYPHHIQRLEETKEHGTLRWIYSNMYRGFVTAKRDNLVVDFDASGRVCDVGFATVDDAGCVNESTCAQ